MHKNLKYIAVGAVIVVFSPIIMPIYLCYAVGKYVLEKIGAA